MSSYGWSRRPFAQEVKSPQRASSRLGTSWEEWLSRFLGPLSIEDRRRAEFSARRVSLALAPEEPSDVGGYVSEQLEYAEMPGRALWLYVTFCMQ